MKNTRHVNQAGGTPVLFVNLPTVPWRELEKGIKGTAHAFSSISLPLGILYVASSCRKKNSGAQLAMLDYMATAPRLNEYESVHAFIDDVARTTVRTPPAIIAFSLNFSSAHTFFVEALETLADIWPNAIKVVGGHHATSTAGRLLENEKLDYVFMGEGELAFAEFIWRYQRDMDIDAIAGVYQKATVAKALSGGHCAMAEDIDTLPIPAWDIIDMDVYATSPFRRKLTSGGEIKRAMPILTSRGCPFSCTFCASHVVHGRIMRRRSPDKVVEEMRALNERYQVELFIPEDDLFISNKSHALALLAAITEADIPNVEFQFANGLNVNTLDEEIIDALVTAGMSIAFVAIESGSKEIQRNLIKKRCNLEKAPRLVSYMQSKGVMVRTFYILGFPGESVAQMEETIQYARDLNTDWSSFFISAPLVGSDQYKDFIAAGVIEDSPETWGDVVTFQRRFDTPEITAANLNHMRERANIEINFARNRSFWAGDYQAALNLFFDIVTKYPYHVIGWRRILACHEKLGDEEKAANTRAHIKALLRNDPRSIKMNSTYGYLLDENATFADHKKSE